MENKYLHTKYTKYKKSNTIQKYQPSSSTYKDSISILSKNEFNIHKLYSKVNDNENFGYNYKNQPLTLSSTKILPSNDILTKISLLKNELLLDIKEKPYKPFGKLDSPLPTKIFNWLLLGDKNISENIGILLKNSVDSIINVTLECINRFPDKFEYKKIPVCDTPYTNIQFYFDSTADYIEEKRKKGKTVFVHCHMGKSRSVSIIISYMIKYHSFSYESAFAYIKQLKPDIKPNRGFIKQLRIYKDFVNKK